MGTFATQVVAVGGHGCQREKKSGETVEGCGDVEHCPDCAAREYVKRLQGMGCSISIATHTHWPDGDPTITDNLKTGRRTGSF